MERVLAAMLVVAVAYAAVARQLFEAIVEGHTAKLLAALILLVAAVLVAFVVAEPPVLGHSTETVMGLMFAATAGALWILPRAVTAVTALLGA